MHIKKPQDTKQVIIVNEEVMMSPGKIAAQVAHAATKAVTGLFQKGFIYNKVEGDPDYRLMIDTHFEGPLLTWIENEHKKIVLKASYNEMTRLYNLAVELKIPAAFIIDNGHTELNPFTPTCAAIGPYWSNKLYEITGHLKLL
jgi:PTH2 family peptidyl-tRNA hydrolase